MAVGSQNHQSRPLGFERTRHMFHNRDFRVQRVCFGPSIHGSEAVLRHSTHRDHGHSRHALNWSFWLRASRCLSSNFSMACRVGVLVQSSDCKDPSRTTLARRQEIQAATSLLGCLCWHVGVRVFPGIHLSLVELCLNPLSRLDARDWTQSSGPDQFVWGSDQQPRSWLV